ncbi:MAG TPA: NAD(+)/NADH kinase [Rhodothermales bacterium]|nr:NAD(+)/NADH kinase [Rhodothermales bacterium]
MIYGITGNGEKERLWEPVADLATWLLEGDIPFVLHPTLAAGLIERRLLDEETCSERSREDLPSACDIVLSFGGDGTLLNSLREVGAAETPILGVNIGRLGFLTGVEVDSVRDAIGEMERGDYRVEARSMLEARIEGDHQTMYAANEFLVTRADSTQMIALDVEVDGVFLNRYWADGLLVATATGSTAYSLSVGGPIIAPGSGVICITPAAPHTLTVRPIILPERIVVRVMASRSQGPYTLAADGIPRHVDDPDRVIEIRESSRKMRLVQLSHRDYFETLRQKLGWGMGHKA